MSGRSLRLEVVLKAFDKASKPLREITGNSRALSKGLKDARARIKELSDTQKRVGEFRELRRGMQDTNAKARAAQERVRQLAQQIKAAERPTRALTREHQQAVRAARALSAQLAQERQRLDGVRAGLAASGISTKNLAHHQRVLTTQTAAASRALREHEERLARVNKQQQRLHATRARFDKSKRLAGNVASAGAAGGAVGGGILFGAKQLLAPGYDFNASMSRVQALARIDRNSPEFAALRAQARQLGATTSYTAGQAADGQGFLAMAGFRPDQILKSMPSVLAMSKAGDLDLARAADISSNILSGFGLDADEMKRVADVLTVTFTTSNTTLEMLGDTMKYAGPVAKAAGMSLEQAAAAAGLLGNAGIQGSRAGTTLRAMLLRLASPTSGAAAALKELGVRALDTTGNVRDIPTILRDVAVATEKMGSGKRVGYLKAIFGEEPAAGMAELIAQQGVKGIDRYAKIVTASAGAAEKVAAVMANNLKGDVLNAISAWEDLGITVSDTVDPSLRAVVQRVTEITGAISQWATAHPELTRNLTQVMLVLGGILAALGSLTLILATVLVPLAAVKMSLGVLGIRGFGLLGVILRLGGHALPMLGQALLIVGRALVASPIGLIATAIALAAFLIIKYWTPIKAFMIGIFDGIAAALANVPAMFGAFVDTARGVMAGGLAAIGSLILDWSPLGLFVRSFAALFGWFGIQLPAQFSTFGQQILQGLASGIMGGLTTVKAAIRSVGDGVVGWFKERLGIHSPSRVFAALGGWTMAGLEQGLRNGQQGPLATVLELGKRIVAAGAGIGISGAEIAGSAPLVVDNRPPLSSAPASSASVAVAAAPITINVYAAPGMDVHALARQVQQVLRQEQSAQAARARSRLGDRD